MKIHVTDTVHLFTPGETFTDWREAMTHIATLPPCYVVVTTRDPSVHFSDDLTITFAGKSELVLGAMRRHKEATDHE